MARRSMSVWELACGLVVATVAWGWSAPLHAAVDAWELIHPRSFEWNNVAHRKAVAEDLIGRIGLLQGVVPPQSPERRARVAEELAYLDRLEAGSEATRRGRFYTSRHYQHYRLLDVLREVQENLACVVKSERIEQEMHCWSLASFHLSDEAKLDLGLSVLRNARMIPRDGKMPVKAQDPAIWYGEYGRGVLRYILVPYLSDESNPAVARCPP